MIRTESRWLLGIGLVLGIILLVATMASADDHLCEIDGEAGFVTIDGSCMTPSRYDEMYSYENLSTIPSWYDPSISIAEAAGMVPDDTLASDRLLGIGLVEEPFTFKEYVVRLWTATGVNIT